MDLADLSIRRPVFITCIIFLMLVVGWISFKKLPVDLYPNVEFPIVTVTVVYPGAGPSEMETLVTKAIEEEISVIAGLKRVTSQSVEGTSQVMAEFNLGIDAQYAEQQIRDKVGSARPRLPNDVLEPVIRRLDPSALPIMTLALQGDAGDARLYDIADQVVKPQMEKIAGVGLVDLVGGRKREVHVELDRQKLARREVSVLAVASRVGESGENVPSGTVDRGSRQLAFRTLGQYQSLKDIENVVIDLFLNAEPTRIADVGTVTESLTDERTRVFVNGKKGLFLNVYKQSGANTISVADGVHEQMKRMETNLSGLPEKGKLNVVRDSSDFIRRDVTDVKETILIGVILTVIVVYLFLANGRSTIITGLALPNSLIGAFVLMYLAGFSVNIVTLLALTLAIGLLIDDAIVVRENIFRHLEKGEDPVVAAYQGTAEVRLAVVATTLVVICVFAPVAFMGGIIGQFMRQFGLTICFAMVISLFDALTVAPMLSAYFAGSADGSDHDSGHSRENKTSLWGRTMGRVLRNFDRLQNRWEEKYERFIRGTLKRPGLTLATCLAISLLATATFYKIPRVFLPEPDSGEFMVSMETTPGTNLEAMSSIATRVDQIVRSNKEVQITTLTVGGQFGESNEASIYVRLLPFANRKVSTATVKDRLRGQLASFKEGQPTVRAFDPFGGGQDQPVMLNLVGDNQAELERYGDLLVAKMKTDPRLRDVESSYKTGKPEFQIQPKQEMMQVLGVNSRTIGNELHAQVQGVTPAKFRESGLEYDVRVRLKPDQRDLFSSFDEILVPNVNFRLIKLENVASPVQTRGPAVVNRQDRGRFIQVVADLTPGASQADVLDDIEKALHSELKIPANMSFAFVGSSENFQDMGRQMTIAFSLGVLLIYLVLASLYESFITPFTIMLALPLALCGAFLALFLANEYMSLFSMLGIVMLLGVASKNSILLVDYARQLMDDEKLSREDAVTKAGRTRLRPILMTSMALIAGTLPVALGLNEASKQRTSMGWAIIGGMVSSTLLSLVVIPVAFIYIDRFRVWANVWMRRWTGARALVSLPAMSVPSPSASRPPGGQFDGQFDGQFEGQTFAGQRAPLVSAGGVSHREHQDESRREIHPH